MPFIFTANATRELLRAPTPIIENRIKTDVPERILGPTRYGITPNGTYFLCQLRYQKNLPDYGAVTIMALIDKYAATTDLAKREKLKTRMIEAGGTQLAGMALLFSNTQEVYGFVTGTGIKVAKQSDDDLLALNDNEVFTFKNERLDHYYVFILDNYNLQDPDPIKEYVCDAKNNQPINMSVINAIHCIEKPHSLHKDMNLYLKTACEKVENSELRSQLNTVYDMLQLLNDNKEIKIQIIPIILQILHANDSEHRKQLLTAHFKLAAELYGSNIPVLMIIGVASFLLGVTLILMGILAAAPMTMPLILGSLSMIVGILTALQGKNNFYSEENKQNRQIANSLFALNKAFDSQKEAIIPAKIESKLA